MISLPEPEGFEAVSQWLSASDTTGTYVDNPRTPPGCRQRIQANEG